jgi:hypothetical protein
MPLIINRIITNDWLKSKKRCVFFFKSFIVKDLRAKYLVSGSAFSILIKAVGFGGKDEIVCVQAVDFVSPESKFCPAPAEVNIGMMADFLGQCADFIDEIEGKFEIFKFECFFELMLIDYLPACGKLRGKSGKVGAFQRFDTTLTWNAFAVYQITIIFLRHKSLIILL